MTVLESPMSSHAEGQERWFLCLCRTIVLYGLLGNVGSVCDELPCMILDARRCPNSNHQLQIWSWAAPAVTFNIWLACARAENVRPVAPQVAVSMQEDSEMHFYLPAIDGDNDAGQ